jgi:hypothetical protein
MFSILNVYVLKLDLISIGIAVPRGILKKDHSPEFRVQFLPDCFAW